jgi:hypothetical protein
MDDLCEIGPAWKLALVAPYFMCYVSDQMGLLTTCSWSLKSQATETTCKLVAGLVGSTGCSGFM